MSDCEQFAQVAHDKWANEQIALFSEQITYLLICSQKTSDSLNKIWLKCFFWYVFCRFFEKTSDFLISSFLMSDMSKKLRLLTKNEWTWVIRSGRSPKMNKLQGWEFSHWFSEGIARFLRKNEQISKQIAHGHSFLVSNLSNSLTSLIFGERPE